MRKEKMPHMEVEEKLFLNAKLPALVEYTPPKPTEEEYKC
jgi:hypothetical protein